MSKNKSIPPKAIIPVKKEYLFQYAPIAGVILVLSGLLLLLDQRLKTGWISTFIPVLISLVLILFGINKKKVWWIVTGLIAIGLGTALVLVFNKAFQIDTFNRLGFAFLANFITWICVFTVILLMKKNLPWWALFGSLTCAALAFIYLTKKESLLDYIFMLAIAESIVFLAWGFIRGEIGLIIPGALLGTIGAGVYFGWNNPGIPSELQKTGVMLVWFALGWILITVLSRVIEKKFIWWPLIPGGILLTVGSGLYIGGDPGNALGFISNTGSIGLILVGAYLIFLKFGMKR